jgi:transposase-like protein
MRREKEPKMTKKTRTHYTPAFKAKVAMDALRNVDTVANLSKRYKVNANLVTKWKSALVEGSAAVFERGGGAGSTSDGDADRAELLKKIGQLTLEVDFLARGLERFR